MMREAIAVISRVDPGIHDEIEAFLACIYLAIANKDPLAKRFGGVTSLQVWGASFVNVEFYKTRWDAVQFLVHEITHSLLLGLSCDQPLVRNSPDESYKSPLRADPRPMDGTFHATLVCARLAAFNRAWLDCGLVEEDDRDRTEAAIEKNSRSFRDGLVVVNQHGKLSETRPPSGRPELPRAFGVRLTISLSGPAFDRPPGMAETLADFIQSRVERNPGVRYVEINQAGERVSRILAELHRRALEILPALRDRAPSGESDVVLCFESVLDFVPAAWACIYGGYSCLPWHVTKSSGRDQEIHARLEAIGHRLEHPVLLTTDDIKNRVIGRGGSPFRTAISIDRELPDQSGAVAPAGTLTLPTTSSARDAAFLISTSGTTAAAKIAIIKHQCSLNRFLGLPEQLSKRARVFFFPFDGVTGMEIVYPGLADRIYLQPGRLAAQPLELLKIVEEFRLQGFGISSSVLARILDATERGPERLDLSSLKQVSLGAEMIVPDVVRKLGAQFLEMAAADLKVSFGYGMTETGLICCTEQLGIDQAVERLIGDGDQVSVGPCVAGWSLRIVDDDGSSLPPETTGNIEAWSDVQLFAGYRNDPELNAQSFTQDGWFRTGDIGIVKDGALTITGRQKATIIVNAKKFSLESIEAPLRRMEGVRRSLAAAAAVRREGSSTDELAVFFVPRDDDNAGVDAICRKILHEIGQHSGIPVKHLVLVSEADFPLTATGKVRRDELLRLYQSGVLTPHALARPDGTGAVRPCTDTERWLTELWKKVLRLEFLPAPEDSFFELGGDLLASAELIFAVEEKFSCVLPLEVFFQHPTIATLDNLVKQHETAVQSKSTITIGRWRIPAFA